MGNFSELSGFIQKDQIGSLTIGGKNLNPSYKSFHFLDEFYYKNPGVDLLNKYTFGVTSQTALPSAFIQNPLGKVGGNIGFVNGGGIGSEIIMRPGIGTSGPPLLSGLVNRKSEIRFLMNFAGDVSSSLSPSEWQLGIGYSGTAPAQSGNHIVENVGVFFLCRDPGFGNTPIAGRIYAQTNGTTITTTDTGVDQSAVALQELCIVNNKSSITYLINGAIVATHSTGIPTDGRGRPWIYMIDPAGASPPNGFTLDNWLIWADRNN